MVIVSIVATAKSIRYGNANTELVLVGALDALTDGAGVGGFEIDGTGLNPRRDIESVAESAGEGSVSAEGICAGTGAGIARGARTMGLEGDNRAGVSSGAPVDGVEAPPLLLEDAPTSTETVSSRPLSTATCLVSAWSSPPETPGRNSYRMGENFTATLAFLCPGSCATGGRAKLARE